MMCYFLSASSNQSAFNYPIVLFVQSAFHLLQDHHQVCADRVGIIGLSFGVYLTLRMATQSGVKVRQKVQYLSFFPQFTE